MFFDLHACSEQTNGVMPHQFFSSTSQCRFVKPKNSRDPVYNEGTEGALQKFAGQPKDLFIPGTARKMKIEMDRDIFWTKEYKQ